MKRMMREAGKHLGTFHPPMFTNRLDADLSLTQVTAVTHEGNKSTAAFGEFLSPLCKHYFFLNLQINHPGLKTEKFQILHVCGSFHGMLPVKQSLKNVCLY